MENHDPGVIEKALALFKAVLADGGARPLAAIAAERGVPLSTAQRWMATFERQNVLVQTSRGRRAPGLGLLSLIQHFDRDEVMRAAALPYLRRFARKHRTAVHLGIWDGEMVTYVAKASSGPAIFTRERMKLEGYSSAIGKVLLANLPAEAQDAYLATGPFVRLTPRTIVSPDNLRRELARVARQGFAVDDEEVKEGLRCVAMPVRGPAGRVECALSTSTEQMPPRSEREIIEELRVLRNSVEARLYA